MPGGRNSGAVYNMYKVKYKKHKRSNGNTTPGSTPGTPTGSNHGFGSNGSKGTPNYSPHNICPPPSPISSNNNFPTNGRPGSNNPYSQQDRLSFESQGSSSNTSLVTSGGMNPGGGPPGLLHTNFNLQSVLPNQPPPTTSEALVNMYNPNKGLLGGVGILRAALTGSGDVSYSSIQMILLSVTRFKLSLRFSFLITE